MAVHAHPDDEASSTGGILARYSKEGIETILVTCTDGAFGDAPGGIKPDGEGFDEDLVVETRREELEMSCSILGVGHLERLEYHDSGMMGWPGNNLEKAFWQIPIEVAAEPLVTLMERFRPDVLVTYDADGGYGHPDHIQAHRIAMHAAHVTQIPSKIYFAAIPRSAFHTIKAASRAAGMHYFDGEEDREYGTPDELVTTRVDCTSEVRKKHAALAAHASQTADSFFFKLPDQLFDEVFGMEHFVRHEDRTGAAVPETDLFAGLR